MAPFGGVASASLAPSAVQPPAASSAEVSPSAGPSPSRSAERAASDRNGTSRAAAVLPPVLREATPPLDR